MRIVQEIKENARIVRMIKGKIQHPMCRMHEIKLQIKNAKSTKMIQDNVAQKNTQEGGGELGFLKN